jgi:hypothetical protein
MTQTTHNILWVKTEAQKKRFKDHEASVTRSEDGS